jgi:hypothetical protein
MPNDDLDKMVSQVLRGARAILRDKGQAPLPSKLNKEANKKRFKGAGIMPHGMGISAREHKGIERINKAREKYKKGNKLQERRKSARSKAKQALKNARNYNLDNVGSMITKNKFRDEDNKKVNKPEFK